MKKFILVSWQVDCMKQSFIIVLEVIMCQNDCILALGKVLQCSCEVANAHDPYTVKVMKAETTVQLDLNFKNARVCNCTRTARA